jgi:CubicO group peptidase (beta-lactamase class C family)
VLVLAEEQRLSLDDAVVRHLPDFTQLPPALTIRQLLNHTSGVRELLFEPAAHYEVYRHKRPCGSCHSGSG